MVSHDDISLVAYSSVYAATKLTKNKIHQAHCFSENEWTTTTTTTTSTTTQIFIFDLCAERCARSLSLYLNTRVIYQEKCTQNWFFLNLLFLNIWLFFIFLFSNFCTLYSFFRAWDAKKKQKKNGKMINDFNIFFSSSFSFIHHQLRVFFFCFTNYYFSAARTITQQMKRK